MEQIKSSYHGERIYKVNTAKLNSLLSDDTTLNHFERHIIQEGVKQVLLGQGTEQIYIFEGDNTHYANKVTNEMLTLLLDYKVIES